MRAAAAVLAAAAVAVSVAAVVLAAVYHTTWGVDGWYFAVDVVVGVVYAGAGWLILSRRPHAVGWTFAGAALGGAVAAFGFAYQATRAEHPGLPWGTAITSAVAWGWVPGTLALVAVVPWLVRAGRAPRRAKAAVAAGWVLALAVTAMRLTDPWPWPEGDPFALLPIRSQGWRDFCERAVPWSMGLLVVAGLAATADVVWRWRTAPLDERRGLGWLAVGSFVMAISFAPLALPSQWLGNSVAVSTFTPVSHLVAQAFMPAAAAVAILRQRMWGIDLAFSRTVVWGLLTGLLAALYVGVVALAGVFVGDGAAAGLAGAALALAIGPARSWLQRRVDHLVRGSATDAARAVRRMGRQLGDAGSDEELLTTLAEGVRDSLRLASVEVQVPVPGDAETPPRRRLVAVGEVVDGSPGGFGEVPLEVRSTTVGWMRVRTPPGLRLDARSAAVLASVAPVVASAVALADLTAEVQQARTRLTAARVQERRVLRREIHDGLGPALAGIGLGLSAYRNLRDVDRARADELLDALCREVEQRAAEVRSLSRALLPPALEEVGLGMALAELAARYDASELDVTLDVDLRSVVPMPIAAAAYAVAAEALVNAHRHASASHVTISVTDSDGLTITVDDDGVGLPSDLALGIGLRSMHERAADLGGSCTVSDGPLGGARVTARLPVTTTAAGRP